MLLGTRFRQIKAVVALSPSGVVSGGLRAEDGLEKPAWTYEGHPVTFMRLTLDQQKRIEANLQTESASPAQLFHIVLENQAAVDKATIPVEQINGPILLISGKADGIWPSTMLTDRIMQRLTPANHPFPDRHLAYEGTGHFIPIPNFPTTVSTMVHPVTKTGINLGGDPAHTAAAATGDWGQLLAFLHEHLR